MNTDVQPVPEPPEPERASVTNRVNALGSGYIFQGRDVGGDIHVYPTPAYTPPRQVPPPPRRWQTNHAGLLDVASAVVMHGASVLVLEGPHDVGKTALAQCIAEAWADSYPDGQLYADAGPHPHDGPARPEDILTRWLTALAARHVPAGLAELSTTWRTYTADRQVLTVIDDAVTASQVRPLLHVGGLVLITTRESLAGLAVFGAQYIQVGPPGEQDQAGQDR